MNKNIKFYTKEFTHLTIDELYEILKLRAKVFIVEQNCVYQDIDNKDQKAMHILGYKNNKLIAYARIFKANDYFKYASIGRVVISEKERSNQYGFKLMETSILAINIHFKEFKIAISAQEHLEKFYNNLGFISTGKKYLEDGIPHIYMIK
ncbi:MAG TPA: GNAT family N-acetyltransferase [Flavobacteriaceae bacterium]|nr:GNAT family N-acetyltransferase [Flavobacteriaceae bacterium]HIP27392.1 GNAT family N-acetyltransferase [Flavobacteriaceae bacterium]